MLFTEPGSALVGIPIGKIYQKGLLMSKRKVLIAIHQLNIGGVQKSLIPALDAIDYSENEVTLYVRKDHTDLLDQVNKNVSKIIINKDKTRHYRKPYAVWLQLLWIVSHSQKIQRELDNFINQSKMQCEKRLYFSDGIKYDVAVSYIQSQTAEFVAEKVNATRKVLFFRSSTDENHELHERIMEKFDSIYCVSYGSKKVLSELYPMYSKKMRVIDTFVSTESVRNSSIEYSVKCDRFFITSCGRLSPEKGFNLAVKAASILKEKKIDFIWWFVGDGLERDRVETLISDCGLESNIRITGLLQNPYPYIGSCDLYVQPSYEESFGRTITEALILKRFIVSTKTIGAVEQIENEQNGLLVDLSAEGIADGIIRFMSDNELRNRIKTNLEQNRYYQSEKEYKEKWKELLR